MFPDVCCKNGRKLISTVAKSCFRAYISSLLLGESISKSHSFVLYFQLGRTKSEYTSLQTPHQPKGRENKFQYNSAQHGKKMTLVSLKQRSCSTNLNPTQDNSDLPDSTYKI